MIGAVILSIHALQLVMQLQAQQRKKTNGSTVFDIFYLYMYGIETQIIDLLVAASIWLYYKYKNRNWK